MSKHIYLKTLVYIPLGSDSELFPSILLHHHHFSTNHFNYERTWLLIPEGEVEEYKKKTWTHFSKPVDLPKRSFPIASGRGSEAAAALNNNLCTNKYYRIIFRCVSRGPE